MLNFLFGILVSYKVAVDAFWLYLCSNCSVNELWIYLVIYLFIPFQIFIHDTKKTAQELYYTGPVMNLDLDQYRLGLLAAMITGCRLQVCGASWGLYIIEFNFWKTWAPTMSENGKSWLSLSGFHLKCFQSIRKSSQLNVNRFVLLKKTNHLEYPYIYQVLFWKIREKLCTMLRHSWVV